MVPTSIPRRDGAKCDLADRVFSLLFAMALVAIGDRGKPVLDVLRGIADAMFKITEYVMRFAPFGVFAAMVVAVGTQGPG